MNLADARVPRLLEAMRLVETERNLPALLRRLVEVARELVDAHYGALGVLDEGGRLVEFVTVGLSEAEEAAIGARPRGRGLLGHLVADPRPLRLRDLGSHPASSGFPDHHPPMRTFLGVPIRGRHRVFGNFYLTEKAGGADFTPEDEELAAALAAWAGVSIENARLYEATHEREQWLDAVREVTTALLEGAELGDVLQLVANRARELARADLATIGIPAEDPEQLTIAAADGIHAHRVRGVVFPVEHSVAGAVIAAGEPVLLDDAGADPRVYQPVVELGDIGPAMFVPIRTRGGVFGTLTVANLRGGRHFDGEEVGLVETFAHQAAIVLEYGRVQRELQRLTLLEERERIAHDLHDTVIQRLFATGMTLQSTARLAQVPEVVRRLQQAVDDLDTTIRDIRSTIFSLETMRRQGRGLRSDVLALAGQSAGSLGFDPQVRFEGPIDSSVTEEVAEHLLPTLQEALSNVARHARADSAEVFLGVDGDVVLRVSDNGIGPPDSTGRHGRGLRNMASRAHVLGGSLEVRSADGGGTVLEWRVPRVSLLGGGA